VDFWLDPVEVQVESERSEWVDKLSESVDSGGSGEGGAER